jgi:O-antigen ligase
VEKTFGKYFWLIVLIFLNIVLTVSRGAYLAAGITVVILFVYLIFIYKKKIYTKVAGSAGAIILSAIIAVLMISFLNGTSNVSGFFNHATANDSTNAVSVTGRQAGYKSAINEYYKSPILGIGVGNSSILPEPVIDNGEVFTRGTINNEYLEILSETGIIGFLIFLAFALLLIVELFQVYKTKNTEGKIGLVALFLGIVAIFIQYNFFSTLYIIYIWVFLALLKSETYAIKSPN